MICPGCQSDFWGLFASLDGTHRCAACRKEADRRYVPPRRVIRVEKLGRPTARPFTVDECRERALCIRCCQPAKRYDGPGDNYGVHCERHAAQSAAKQRAKLVRDRAQERQEGAA